MPYVAKDFGALVGMDGFSETLLKNHFTLYQGYVANTNKLSDLLGGMLAEGKTARAKAHGTAGNGHRTVKVVPPTACGCVGSMPERIHRMDRCRSCAVRPMPGSACAFPWRWSGRPCRQTTTAMPCGSGWARSAVSSRMRRGR